MVDASWLSARRCLREPIQEIWEAAKLLSAAVDFHLAGDRETCAQLIVQADMPLYEWTESLWGPKSQEIHRYRDVLGLPPLLVREGRVEDRMPSSAIRKQLQERDGFHCRFCGIPVIDKKIRVAIRAVFPTELRWGRTNPSQHAAFQCMWLQYDHVVPHCRGGDNSLENIVVTCAGCNFGKTNKTIQELGILDPRERSPDLSPWDGLNRFIAVLN